MSKTPIEQARFAILDSVPCDVWQEPEHQHAPLAGTSNDPDKYLCIVDAEPYDYYGSFTACTFTAALYQGEHVGVSGEYLRDRCTLAPEPIARKILAFYLRNWAHYEDDDTAELLRDAAEEVANG
jgi:hypothetical protein